MNKIEAKKGGDGYWFERSRHWCQYPVATRNPVNEKADAGDRKYPGQEPRKLGSRPRRAARRLYAKQVRYTQTAVVSGFKKWLSAQ